VSAWVPAPPVTARGGQRVRKDTKTHQDRWLAIDPVTAEPDARFRAVDKRGGPGSPKSRRR
jgi:hypothetical protein